MIKQVITIIIPDLAYNIDLSFLKEIALELSNNNKDKDNTKKSKPIVILTIKSKRAILLTVFLIIMTQFLIVRITYNFIFKNL